MGAFDGVPACFGISQGRGVELEWDRTGLLLQAVCGAVPTVKRTARAKKNRVFNLTGAESSTIFLFAH
jgi:hypothetical protein